MTKLNDKYICNENIPCYLSCRSVLKHEWLTNQGCYSDLIIGANIDLLSFPAISVTNDFFEVTPYKNKLLGYKEYNNYFGIEEKRMEFESLTKGIEYIKKSIYACMPVIVSGTQYHLPYLSMYKNSEYFKDYNQKIYGVANHWITVLAYNDSIFVRDSTFNYKGNIKLNDFHLFWEGDKQFADISNVLENSGILKFGVLNVSVDKEINSNIQKEFTYDIIKTFCLEYKRGFIHNCDNTTTYYGIASFKWLINYLSYKKIDKDSSIMFYNCLHNLKFCFLLFKDLLNKKYDDFNEFIILANLIEEYEEFCMKFYMNIKRNKLTSLFQKEVETYLNKLNNDLINICDSLLIKTNMYNGLEKRDGIL